MANMRRPEPAMSFLPVSTSVPVHTEPSESVSIEVENKRKKGKQISLMFHPLLRSPNARSTYPEDEQQAESSTQAGSPPQ